MVEVYEFVVRVPATDPPPNYRELIKKALTKEVRLCMGKNATVDDLFATAPAVLRSEPPAGLIQKSYTAEGAAAMVSEGRGFPMPQPIPQHGPLRTVECDDVYYARSVHEAHAYRDGLGDAWCPGRHRREKSNS